MVNLTTTKYFLVLHLLKKIKKLERSMINRNECVCSKIFMVGTYLCNKYLDSVKTFRFFSLKCVVAL